AVAPDTIGGMDRRHLSAHRLPQGAGRDRQQTRASPLGAAQPQRVAACACNSGLKTLPTTARRTSYDDGQTDAARTWLTWRPQHVADERMRAQRAVPSMARVRTDHST